MVSLRLAFLFTDTKNSMNRKVSVTACRMAEKKAAEASPQLCEHVCEPECMPKKKHPGTFGYKMEQALISEYVPMVIHPGRHKPESLCYAFYNPNYSNSYTPFYTLQKPTCGYRYSRDTDHRRKVLDVERVNIPKWRTIVVPKPGLSSIGSKP